MNKKDEAGMNGNELIQLEDIQTRIHTIRGVQVMLDGDLAELYGVEVKRLNEQVKRNIERFPESFCFKLNDSEMHILISQIVISNNKINLKSQIATSSWGGRRTNTYAFTEQGVAMLSAVLRSETAVKISVQIINAFVTMRRFIASNALIFQRLDTLETKQLVTDKKIDHVLNAIEIKEFKNSHDRFIIIDNTTVYHFGASLKDLGKKWFAFSKMDIGAIEMLGRLEGMK